MKYILTRDPFTFFIRLLFTHTMVNNHLSSLYFLLILSSLLCFCIQKYKKITFRFRFSKNLPMDVPLLSLIFLLSLFTTWKTLSRTNHVKKFRVLVKWINFKFNFNLKKLGIFRFVLLWLDSLLTYRINIYLLHKVCLTFVLLK